MTSQARYAIIPTAALEDAELSAQDIRILAALGSYLSRENQGWPSQSTIAERAFCTRETVNRTLKRLIDKGYVEAKARNNSGMKRSNTYRVILDVIPESQRCDPGVTTDVIPEDHNRCDPATSQQEEETHKKRIKEDLGVKEAFDHYNRTARFAGWPSAAKLTAKRTSALQSRLKDFGLEQWKRTVDHAATLPWCCGQGSRKWFADLDYLSRESGFLKIFETLPKEHDLLSVGGSGSSSSLEHAFTVLAEHGEWLGERYGFPVDPRDPRADYDADLYDRFGVKRRAA